jgi:GWxTD domain-containing protein
MEWLEDDLTDAARDSFIDLDPSLRPAAWADIWFRRALAEETTPALAERSYLLRIVAADDRFGGHQRGALSDRGRTLIRWGEPTRVESYPDSRTPGAAWEVWEYQMRRRRVLFYDAHGMGDFKFRGDEPLVD